MTIGPRELVVPYRPIPLEGPEGMKPNEFFNSAENLSDLVHNNGLLNNPEGLLLYRKALAGHPRSPRSPGAPPAGARARPARVEPDEPDHDRIHAGELS